MPSVIDGLVSSVMEGSVKKGDPKKTTKAFAQVEQEDQVMTGNTNNSDEVFESKLKNINDVGDCIPELTEETGLRSACAQKCTERGRRIDDECEILRKRVNIFLRDRGCSSVVRAYKSCRHCDGKTGNGNRHNRDNRESCASNGNREHKSCGC